MDLAIAKAEAARAASMVGAPVKESKKEAKARKKRERQAKRAARKAAKAGNVEDGATKTFTDDADVSAVAKGNAGELTAEQIRTAKHRAVTGVLASKDEERDLKFDSFSLMVGGNHLVTDCSLQLNQGCRYGLIGGNGSGKSNVLAALAQRELPVPDHIDMYHLHEEAPATEQTGVEAVIAHVHEEVKKLEALAEQITETAGPEDERLEAIYERLDELDPAGSEPRARKILSGLGFCDHMIPMDRKTKHMSGGWRMRVSLAKALFAAPSLLLLDEPTNHLDLEACVWLEEHLANYPKCLLLVSHSEDFLNAVCTNTIWLKPNPHSGEGVGSRGCALKYYGGNYETFMKVTTDEERVQEKAYEKQQADMAKLATFVRVNKANGKASSAKSKKRVLEKIQDGAVDKPMIREPSLVFDFQEMLKLPPPVMPFDKVCFSYSGKKEDYLYEDLSIAVDYDSRIALVGPNGCGKSTLLKLMTGDLQPTEGSIKTHPKLRLGQYHQHSTDVLELDVCPLSFMMKRFPPVSVPKGRGLPRSAENWSSYLTNFGFTRSNQTSPIGLLSDGQRSRLVFAMLAMSPCGVLLLDEPTNHLDIDAVSGLAKAIKAFQGGVVLVSHDFRLIDQVAKEIWVCEDKGVSVFKGAIRDYKKILAKSMKQHQVIQRRR